MNDTSTPDSKAAHIEAYKTILRKVPDQRPSGTRQRLASALGKKRSFISHLCNPAYPVPIPAPHLEVIFEICHFSPADKRAFLDSFGRAHPSRGRQVRESPSLRSLKLEVYDFGDARRNRAFDELLRDTTHRLARLIAPDD